MGHHAPTPTSSQVESSPHSPVPQDLMLQDGPEITATTAAAARKQLSKLQEEAVMLPEDGRDLRLASGRLLSVPTTSMDTGREERSE